VKGEISMSMGKLKAVGKTVVLIMIGLAVGKAASTALKGAGVNIAA
jgi:hypothetical protein